MTKPEAATFHVGEEVPSLQKWEAASSAYVDMVAKCRVVRESMLALEYGQMLEGEAGTYFQSQAFVIGQTVEYGLGGEKAGSLINARLQVIDNAAWGFGLEMVDEGCTFVRAAAGEITGSSANRYINEVLRRPDTIDVTVGVQMDRFFAASPMAERHYSGYLVIPWWLDIVNEQSVTGVNILKQTVAALGDTEFNPDPLCAQVGEDLRAKLAFAIDA